MALKMIIDNKNKRGIVRIMEVMLAITLLSGVILYVYANQQIDPLSIDEYIYNYQKEILNEVSTNPLYRDSYVLPHYHGEPDKEDKILQAEGDLEQFIRGQIPYNLNFSIRICYLNETVCNLEPELFTALLEDEIYVLDTIVASDGNPANAHKKVDRKSTRLNSSHSQQSRMPSSA